MPGSNWRPNGLGALMLWTAGVAVACAVSRSLLVVGLMLGYPLGLLALCGAAARWGRVSRPRAATWVSTAYPWLALGVAFGLRGLIDPRRSGTDLAEAAALLVRGAVVCLPVALIANVALATSEALLVGERGGSHHEAEVCRLVLIPIASWALALAVAWIWLAIDPSAWPS